MVCTVSYGTLLRFMEQKNSVCNLQFGPQIWLVKGIHCVTLPLSRTFED